MNSLLLGAALCSCVTEGTNVRATISQAPLPCDIGHSAGSQRVAGAAVSMLCPQVIKATHPSLFGTTDARGELAFHEPMFGRWIHDGCEILVEKQGFQPLHYPVAEVCTRYSSNHCVSAVVTAELVPVDTPCR